MNNTCIDCGKKLSDPRSVRCTKCSNSGVNNAMYGKRHKTSTREKMSTNRKGIASGIECYWYGKTLTEEHRSKLSKAKDGKYIGKDNPNWMGGISTNPYPLGWNRIFKEQIRYRDGYKCQVCGKPEVESRRRLDVHHIDYDKNNLDVSNLISLCQSCHLKTNYNREMWSMELRNKTEDTDG